MCLAFPAIWLSYSFYSDVISFCETLRVQQDCTTEICYTRLKIVNQPKFRFSSSVDRYPLYNTRPLHNFSRVYQIFRESYKSGIHIRICITLSEFPIGVSKNIKLIQKKN